LTNRHGYTAFRSARLIAAEKVAHAAV
jgi:hypothetical protein